ncbi:MAG TPA: site-specific integrase [Bacteroidia bacterium]|jgi:integrase|nr:site-specific integrase [Bacteroidia bacterium]
MKNKKANYRVSVYLVNDKSSYRLRFFYKGTGKFLPQFEQRLQATCYEDALQKRDAEQAKEKWINYNEESIETKGDFISFFDKIRQEKPHLGTQIIYKNTLISFKHFIGKDALPFNKVSKELANDFKEYLLRKFKQNTANCRFACFAHIVNKAFDENLIERFKVQRIAQVPVKKDVLSEDELNKIIESDWSNQFKKPFLFECLTAISYSDLKRLQWKQIEKKTLLLKGEKKTINKLSFIRQKTNREVTMILSDSMLKMLGERGNDEDYIFPYLVNAWTYNFYIAKLMKQVGINKHITSHCGRATAIIRVTESEGIYTAAKQAGHANINTTLRYAQYTDKMMYSAQNALMNGINL